MMKQQKSTQSNPNRTVLFATHKYMRIVIYVSAYQCYVDTLVIPFMIPLEVRLI